MRWTEALFVGVVSGTGFVLGTSLWYLLVRPQGVLSLFHRRGELDLGDDPRGVQALRLVLGIAVFIAAFAMGVATAFLSRTT